MPEGEMATSAMGETLVQIRIEMGRMNEKLEQMKDVHKDIRAVDDTAKEALHRVKVTENRLNDIESSQSWLKRTVGGSLITTVIGVIILYIKTTGG